jgi:hypothetical protein
MVMYAVIQHVMPLLAVPGEWAAYAKPIGALLLSAGIYKLLATLLLASARRLKFVKRHLLGPHYLQGTWVGRFDGGGSTFYTVELFEQTLSSLQIRGSAFGPNDETYARWISVSTAVNAEKGSLTYTYDCHKSADHVSFQGIGLFLFERDDEASPPTRMNGYSADLIDGHRSDNSERKVSDDLLSLDEGLRLAKT